MVDDGGLAVLRQACARAPALVVGELAKAAVWLGRYEFAYEQLRLAEQLGADTTRGAAATWLCLDWHAGRWLDLCDRAEAVAGAEARLVHGLVLAAQGQPGQARQQLNAVLSDTVATVPVRLTAATALIAQLLADGELGEAAERVSAELETVRRRGAWLWTAEFAPVAVQVLINTGRMVEADQLIAELRLGLADGDAPAASAAHAACQGWLAEARGKPRVAAAVFSLATRRYRALPAPYPAAVCQAAAGRCRLAGDRAVGGRILAAALACLERLGAVAEAGRCRQLLRANDISAASRRGRRGYGAMLSPREREVADLVAAGLTNRQIAATLVISARTVEDHVAHILRKLRVSSRRAIRACEEAA